MGIREIRGLPGYALASTIEYYGRHGRGAAVQQGSIDRRLRRQDRVFRILGGLMAGPSMKISTETARQRIGVVSGANSDVVYLV